MRRWIALWGAVVLVLGLLAGCGGKEEQQDADLSAFWSAEVEKYQWTEDEFAELDDELMENYYPGLKDIPAKQLIAKVPLMSALVQEMVFAEGETEEDAGKIAEILQKRVKDQAEGGAWYPESMEDWGKAQVVTQGRYVAMVASAAHQQEIVDDFNALFEAS